MKTQVFVYKGVLGIESSPDAEGVINKPTEKGQLGFVCDASKVELQQEAVDWLKKVKPSSDCIGDVDVFKANSGMVIFAWLGGPSKVCMDHEKVEGSRDYKPELLTATEGVEVPDKFKEYVEAESSEKSSEPA